MNWNQYWSQSKTILLDLLFPPRCIHCGKAGTLLCTACRQQIAPLSGTLCPGCSRPHTSSQSLCRACRVHPLEVDSLHVVAPFDGIIREAIHHLKYKNARQLAIPLGNLLLDVWKAQPSLADVIVPVPLHKEREQARGYNQSTLLAQRLAQGTGLPLAEHALQRTRQTPPQVGLSAHERWLNVREAFVCPDPHLAGRHPLLIDDVCTTGATLSACAHAFHERGAETVHALVLARPF